MPQNQPISVLRKSGSFASLQQLKSSEALSALSSHDALSDIHMHNRNVRKDTSKVAIINTTPLPNYSTERYYMLSELQLKAHSLLFLQDVFPNSQDDDTNPTEESSSSSSVSIATADDNADAMNTTQTTRTLGLPPYIILYLLWRPDSEHFDSPNSFAKHIIQPAIQKIHTIHRTSPDYQEGSSRSSPPPLSPPIYLAVDRMTTTDSSMNQEQIETYRKQQIALTEKLIRVVATTATVTTTTLNTNTGEECETETQLRTHIDGMAIGLSSDFRAAPGLETCMDAILVGDAERRHFPKRTRTKKQSSNTTTIIRNGREIEPSRSCIGIVTEFPDDLTGLDPVGETDAVQNLSLHARSAGNWSGKGNVLNFAARSQKLWRETWNFAAVSQNGSCNDLQNVGNSYSIMSRRRNRDEVNSPQVKYLPSEQMRLKTEHSADLMIVGFVSFVLAVLWQTYGEQLRLAIAGLMKLGEALAEELRHG